MGKGVAEICLIGLILWPIIRGIQTKTNIFIIAIITVIHTPYILIICGLPLGLAVLGSMYIPEHSFLGFVAGGAIGLTISHQLIDHTYHIFDKLFNSEE